MEQIIFIGISSEPNFEFAQVFIRPLSPVYEYIPDRDTDFDSPTRILTKDKEMIAREKKGSLMDLAPHYEFVGMTGGAVNPAAKPRRILAEIIQNLSEPGETVLDFFSGGQVMHAAFLKDRECFVYCDSQVELNFMSQYAFKLAESSNYIRKFFRSTERKVTGVEEVTAGPILS